VYANPVEDEGPGAEEMLADAVARDPERLAGQQLRRLRIAREWTQEDVAQRMRTAGYASWHQTTIAKIEGAQRPLRVRELVALAGVFGIAPSDLLSPAGWNLQTLEDIEAELPQLEAAREELILKAAAADEALEAGWKARAELARIEDQIRFLHKARDLAAGEN
jgi:transcriptional regulator with XRE-family HTH domain